MVNFSSKNEGTWFYFNEENPDAGGICLRALSSDEYDRIEKITVKKQRKFKRGVAYDDIKTNEALASKLRWDYCIVDWKGVSIDGEPAECNKANKEKTVKIMDFISFVADCMEKLTETNEAIQEARLKNSETSSNGKDENQPATPA